MSFKDIYNKATVYNPVDTRTQAPQHNHASGRPSSSYPTAPSSSRPSTSTTPKPYTTLERDNNSSRRVSLSRPSHQHTMLQRDGQPSSSHGRTPAPQNHTLLNRDQPSSSSSRQPILVHAAATTAPPDAKSMFKTQHDVDMALRQVRYQSMTHDEKKKQDEWVRNFIQHAGPCPAGFSWERVKYGYACNGGNHLCTDDLLAEGKGGYYFGTLDAGWWGPIYNRVSQRLWIESTVHEYAEKHGLDPTVAPVIPEPNLPATGEVHPGIAKAMAGLGHMPRPVSIEYVHSHFTWIGERERTHSGGSYMLGGPPQLSTLYGPGGLPNRLSVSMSNGSLLSPLSQGGQLPLGFGTPHYSHGPHGSGMYGNGPYGQGSYGQGSQGHHRH
ncbi:hypothetical protein SBOR_1789 [Sclerotinia borealis F-4128]|uniref:Uncharacterized protein n=1 Tax=Sclerotinia borealis (strain F-4128) TaxID=1432307 RepID=W9CTF1_SCLBF|nr:hypothetical protein SBOR_1789 [Sclerotinia borealis F-4128]